MSDLDNLKRQLSYTFLDAYGNFDGADILFDSIVKATEERIIKLLEAKADQAMRAGQGKPMPERMEYLAVETSIRQVIALIKGENNV